ncbi:MAG: sulfur carrier protein ThiS [Vulcanimicrobiaceae bacterium]
MTATINGAPRELTEGTTLGGLLAELGLTTNGVAIAVNQRVIPRRTFADHPLQDGDAVEIVRAVAGG